MSKIRVLSEDGAVRFVEKLKEWCKATFALITHTHDAATQSSAGFISASDKTKLDGLSKVTVDSALSTTSTNPVQNKVINNALANKSDITHTHSYAGSSTSGGAATSANKLNTNAGSTSTPVYFTNGVPTACTSVTANSATTASKLGTSTVGGEINPIYLRSGKPFASASTVGSTSKPVFLSSGTLTECTSIAEADSAAEADHATSADSATTATTATTASKLGSSTVGSGTKPIYLSSGTATASTSTVGSTSKPVYMNSGTITACTSVTADSATEADHATSADSATTATTADSATTATTATKLGSTTVGSSTKPIYLSSGTATASTSTVGSSTKPIYMSSGTLTASSSTVGSSSAPVYLNSGTLTQCSSITAATASKLGTSTVGSSTKPIYLNSGTATASTSTVGSTSKPVYLSSGTLTECTGNLCKWGMPTTTSYAADCYVSAKKLLYDSTSGTYSKVTCYVALPSSGRQNWITIYYGSSSGTRRLSTKVFLGSVTSSTTTRNIPLSFNTVASDYTLLIYASQWSCSVSSNGYMTLSCTYNKTYNHCTKTATGSNEIFIYRIEGEGVA